MTVSPQILLAAFKSDTKIVILQLLTRNYNNTELLCNLSILCVITEVRKVDKMFNQPELSNMSGQCRSALPWVQLAFTLRVSQRIPTSLVLNIYHLEQAWATSGPRATYGPPNTLMWPASYIRSFLNTYIDYENILNIKKVPVLLQKQP